MVGNFHGKNVCGKMFLSSWVANETTNEFSLGEILSFDAATLHT